MTSTASNARSLAEPAAPEPAARQLSPKLTAEGEVSEGPRRWLNLGVAALMLVAALPLVAVVSVLIKLTSPGPVFYTQTRIGRNRRGARTPTHWGRARACDLGGKPFVIFKFRTMRSDAERESGIVWARKNDPRVTLIGRILRQTRLDELPQLINVIRGEMNVVGPRPERPSIFARLADEFENYPDRQQVRPGITGLAQVSQQYDTSLDDVRRKLEYDLEYVRTQGVWVDILVMFRTIPVILFRRGGW